MEKECSYYERIGFRYWKHWESNKRFSIPCVISMVVAALYNIVDQIFIGWSEAGAYGNAATNIVYPFTVLALGLALLVGDGAAAGFSIALGKGDKSRLIKMLEMVL